MKVKGTPVSKNILLKYLESAVAEDFKTPLFTNEEPLPNFPVNLDYIGRVIVPLEGVMELAGVYEKKIESRKIVPGNVLYTARNCWINLEHRAEYAKSISVLIMPDYIRLVAAEYNNHRLISNPYYHSSRPPSEILLTLIHALNLLRKQDNYQTQACLLLKTFLLETINELENDEIEQIGKAERSFKLIKEYIDHNYHLPIDLNQICNELEYNPSYVSRMFKKYAKENIKSYIEQRRMAAAREILGNVRLKISQVAKQCGYSSEAYFIKVFKKIHDMTPGEFRDRNLL